MMRFTTLSSLTFLLALAAGCEFYIEASSDQDDDDTDVQTPDAAPTPEPVSCQQPFDPDLELPPVNMGADGRPDFDRWRDVPIDVASRFYCNPSSGIHCGTGTDAESCAILNDAGDGYCTSFDSDIWCDGEGEVLSWADGDCWLCARIEAKAAVCLAGVEGVDCRSWPYQGSGTVGSVCARHDDCQTGLACGEHRGSGYGLCMCPEDTGGDVAPDQQCFQLEF